MTSNNEQDALNYSREEHLGHADRYDRAIEFAEVVNGLRDSWDEDAFIRDPEAGVFLDPAKMHVLNHKGRHFQVRGPLNVACSPQGRPILVQAGASGTGRDVAARLAELVFTAAATFEQARRDKLTFWQLCLANAGPRGHALSIGTPAQVPDEMEHWFRDGATDGFNIMPAWLPGSLKDFVDLFIPELQRRGLFRSEYESTTLRGNLGLPKPTNRHHSSRLAGAAQ